MAGSLPKSRPHSHSLSVGSINPAHRVTRRKSMSTTAGNNVAAMSAAAKGISVAPLLEEEPLSQSQPQSQSLAHHNPARRHSKPATQFRGPSLVHSQSMAASSSMPHNGSAPFSSYSAAKSEAMADGPALASLPESEQGSSKSRMRRASEGQSKRTSGSELRCEKCGKGYKHSSCLTKHLSVPRSHPPSSHILSPLKTNALQAQARGPGHTRLRRPPALLVS